MTNDHGRTISIVAATAVAWAGFFVHNVTELPGQTILSPESLFPTLIWVVALVLYLISATRVVGVWTLLVWAVVNLVGGALSVLPWPFLPFSPPQTVEHYAYHVLYALTQLPLIAVTWLWLRRFAWDKGPSQKPL